MKEPSCRRGPCQIRLMTSASVAVNTAQLGALVPTSVFGSNLHARGFSITPSFTPSAASHAATAAACAAANLQAGTKSSSCFMTTLPHICSTWRRVQLIAGAPARMPS